MGYAQLRINTYKSIVRIGFHNKHLHNFQIMARGKRHSDHLAHSVYALINKKKTNCYIARQLGINESTVRSILSRRIEKSKLQKKKNLGRPRKLKPSSVVRLGLAVKRNPTATYCVLGHRFNVSWDTVRRRSLELKFKTRVAVRNVLQNRHKVVRVAWARTHLQTDFSSWIFSDESIFRLSTSSAPQRVLEHRLDGMKYDPRYVLEIRYSPGHL